MNLKMTVAAVLGIALTIMPAAFGAESTRCRLFLRFDTDEVGLDGIEMSYDPTTRGSMFDLLSVETDRFDRTNNVEVKVKTTNWVKAKTIHAQRARYPQMPPFEIIHDASGIQIEANTKNEDGSPGYAVSVQAGAPIPLAETTGVYAEGWRSTVNATVTLTGTRTLKTSGTLFIGKYCTDLIQQ